MFKQRSSLRSETKREEREMRPDARPVNFFSRRGVCKSLRMGRSSGALRNGATSLAAIGRVGWGVDSFVRRRGLTLRTFEKWYRRQRGVERGKGQFVEVKAPSVGVSPWAVEVELPNGVRLRVRG